MPTYEELEQRVKTLEQEISELKQAQEGLRASEDKWRSLVENSPSLIMIVDRNGIIQYINHTVPGLEVEKVIGTSHYDYAPSEYQKIMKESIEQVFKTGQCTSYEIAGVGPEESTSWYTTKLGPIKRNGEIVAVTIMPTDITEHRQIGGALRESEERYKSLFQGAAEGIIVADIATRTFRYANPAICKMLGYSEEELVGMRVDDIHPQEALESVISEFEAQARGEKTLAPEIPCLRKDGTTIYADIKTTKVLIDGKECNVGFFTDITERKNAEDALREREAALEIQADELQEVNSALRVLLRQRDKDKTELEEKVLSNVRELVLPYVERLRQNVSDAKHIAYLNILESNLNDVISPFARRLSQKYSSLTPTEIQMAHLVKNGRTTKEIAKLLNLSGRTIESHRQNIRMKMGIRNKKANLRAHLLSI